MTGTVINSDNIGKWIKQQRKRYGLSLEDVAQKAGLSKSSIVRMERHSLSPNLYTVERVLEVFGKRLVIIDGGTDEKRGTEIE